MLSESTQEHTKIRPPTAPPLLFRRYSQLAALGGILVLVVITYANHFNNSFHFDDSHTIVDNPWIKSLNNIPRFFTDGRTFSSLPANRSYRPLVSTSLAVDYWLGHGLAPLWFHLSTFFWFTLQLTLMFLLFREVLDRARPGSGVKYKFPNQAVAVFATAVYGVHPAIAETVNYIIQRGDLYSTLGVIASLVIYVRYPGRRRHGLYLLPFVAAMLSKPPALVFPVLLFLWIWLFEEGVRLKSALARCIPALITAAVMGWLTARMTPHSYAPGGLSAYSYRITQPAVLLHYFRTFIVPTGLTADTDRPAYTSLFQDEALPGFLFIGLLILVAVWSARRRETRPVAFGLGWFLIASVPTSVFPLAEVDNDHRMFFPFVGLTLSLFWGAALWLERRKVPRAAVGCGCGILLAGFAWGAHARNEVWRNEESLWLDVTIKSPHNGRGLMNYGLTQMARANYSAALDLFNRALVLDPGYYVLEINLGVVYGAMGNRIEAEKHFMRAIELAPLEASPRFFYARWLNGNGQTQEAVAQLNLAIGQNPDYVASQQLLMQIYADTGDAAGLRAAAQRTLAQFPGDPTALAWLARSANLHPVATAAPSIVPGSAESYLNQSLTLFQAAKYAECIGAAREALRLRPNYAEAWNNIAAAQNGLQKWDEGIQAAEQALRLNPDFQLAKNNLAWARSQKGRTK